MAPSAPRFRDTIFALSSGGLPSGVAVVRVSGPEAFCAYDALVEGERPPPRHAALKTIRCRNGRVIDRCLILLFQEGKSETGEPMLEFQTHGGRALVEILLEELSQLSGFRLAQSGEFAQRAFLNGKVDLTQVEALADLVEAETQTQHQLALANASGRQRALYEGWRLSILQARAMLEAELDFSDEDDIPGSVADKSLQEITTLIDSLGAEIAGARAAEIIRHGFRVAIVGKPNAGKSSLFNALSDRDAAIVTNIPGTTRDVLELALKIEGHKIVLMDSAGLRSTEDQVERLGVERAMQSASAADLVLYLISDENDQPPINWKRVLIVQSKSDQIVKVDARAEVCLSVVTGAGLADLRAKLGALAGEAIGASPDALPSRRRHTDGLKTAYRHLSSALALRAPEIRAEELRLAADALGGITGHIRTDELLGEIFSRFCIGK